MNPKRNNEGRLFPEALFQWVPTERELTIGSKGGTLFGKPSGKKGLLFGQPSQKENGLSLWEDKIGAREKKKRALVQERAFPLVVCFLAGARSSLFPRAVQVEPSRG